MKLNNIILEMSLKPFWDDSPQTMQAICCTLFKQWATLCEQADKVSVLLWISDGSEILDYQGDLSAHFEWAKYIGVANPRTGQTNDEDPQGLSIHHRSYLYRENPPQFTYAWLKQLLVVLKETGQTMTGKPIEVGATFDPGPEFAKSSFKYERHNEICSGNTIGEKSFVCCYATLNEDTHAYAGFPDGIPGDLPFGAFLGKQSQCFSDDLGFDYLWLSNGFGFGLETWGICGAVFDGKTFSTEHCADIKEKSLLFWKSFRAGCPNLPLQTRGTNLSTGMDLSSDAVPLREIYEEGYGIEPPPNSPWAALNGDCGLEMVGWMSHIAELPGNTFPFRFYTHDPWFLNSPWIDRYCREPYDIYLPLSVARLDEAGQLQTPSSIAFLTVDDSYGRMPDLVPNEVTPYILDCLNTMADQTSPLIWVYPFDEYHDITDQDSTRLNEVFFGDWFMRSVVNHGVPLNTVISTANFVSARQAGADAFDGAVLIMSTTIKGATLDTLEQFLEDGGQVLLYGPLENADPRLTHMLDLSIASPIWGEMQFTTTLTGDAVEQACPDKIKHDPLLSGGNICAVQKDKTNHITQILASVQQESQTRAIAVSRHDDRWNGGCLSWVRGSNSFTLNDPPGHQPRMQPADQYVHTELLMRHILSEFGYRFYVSKREHNQKNPVNVISRHNNAFYFAGFSPDITVSQSFCCPQGAPLFLDTETWLNKGCSTYHLPRAWRKECRVFVKQAEGQVRCIERPSIMPGVKRRFYLAGLKNATVTFFHEPGSEGHVKMLRQPSGPNLVGDFIEFTQRQDPQGPCLVAQNISDDLLISW